MTNRLHLSEPHPHDHEEEIEEVRLILPATIYDAEALGEKVPPGFDAVRIGIDGRIKANLSWAKAHAAAQDYIQQGLRLFWEIDLGLWNKLEQPLSSTTQFMSLSLSLEHFRDTLWKEFRDHSVGLCLFRGPIDFSQSLAWDAEQVVNLQTWLQELFGTHAAFSAETGIPVESFASLTRAKLQGTPTGTDLLQLFCRDACGEYLDLLAARLPDTLPLYVLLDAQGFNNIYRLAQLLTKERYPRLHVGIKGERVGGTFAWEGTPLSMGMIGREPHPCKPIETPTIGICFPKMTDCRPAKNAKLKAAMENLHHYTIPFRIIPESYLTVEWDGLDYLIVDSVFVDIPLSRKLHGFCAAGGTVVAVGEMLGLPEEISWETFAVKVQHGAMTFPGIST